MAKPSDRKPQGFVSKLLHPEGDAPSENKDELPDPEEKSAESQADPEPKADAPKPEKLPDDAKYKHRKFDKFKKGNS